MPETRANDQEKKKRKRKRKTKQTLTRAVPHIRLGEANACKLEALERLASAFMALTQRYVTLFCTQEADPNGYLTPVYETELSERWQRVAIQQAAGIAKSWRTNRHHAYTASLADYAAWQEAKQKNPATQRKEPVWQEWNLPELRVTSIQANVNVVKLEPSEDSTFDYWLQIATLEKGQPLRIPVKFATYHKKALTVNPAYSSQECPRCHYVDRANRPTQQTFCCIVCGFRAHADHKAAGTLASRWRDRELAACHTKEEVKALLMQRHEEWKKNQQRAEVIGPPTQLSLWPQPEEFLDRSPVSATPQVNLGACPKSPRAAWDTPRC